MHYTRNFISRVEDDASGELGDLLSSTEPFSCGSHMTTLETKGPIERQLFFMIQFRVCGFMSRVEDDDPVDLHELDRSLHHFHPLVIPFCSDPFPSTGHI